MSFTLALSHDPRDCDGKNSCPCKNVPIIYSIWTASQYGDYNVVKARIDRNSSMVTKLDEYGFSALHYAAQGNHIEIVKLLLDKGCPADGPINNNNNNNNNNSSSNNNNNSSSNNSNDGCGCTPLHRAAYSNSIESVQLLLEYKANINAHDVSFGDYKTPLHKASEQNNLKIVEILLKSKLCNINQTDKNNNTALHLAYMNNHKDIVNLLIEAGVDTEITNNQGYKYNECQGLGLIEDRFDDYDSDHMHNISNNNDSNDNENNDGEVINRIHENENENENKNKNKNSNLKKTNGPNQNRNGSSSNNSSNNNSSSGDPVSFGLCCSSCGVNSLAFTRKANGSLVCMVCK